MESKQYDLKNPDKDTFIFIIPNLRVFIYHDDSLKTKFGVLNFSKNLFSILFCIRK